MNVKQFRKPTTKHFFEGGKAWNFRRGNLCSYWWWMQRNGTRN